eukprot:364612-Chlamydomonas_euryale.AAC.10
MYAYCMRMPLLTRCCTKDVAIREGQGRAARLGRVRRRSKRAAGRAETPALDVADVTVRLGERVQAHGGLDDVRRRSIPDRGVVRTAAGVSQTLRRRTPTAP